MTDSMSYNLPLLALSVLIAIVAGTAALWAGTRVSRMRATVGAALIMGVAVSGMHYTGMAALRIHPGPMPSMAAMASSGGATVSGATAAVFLIPLLLVISIATFAVTLTITMAPGEDEIQADAEMQRRMEYLQQRRDWSQVPSGPPPGWDEALPGTGSDR
jgi:NO-binding membrane sensor protein with MHYT domain